jgi:hypothetical protein
MLSKMNNLRLILKRDGIQVDHFEQPNTTGLVATFTGLGNRDLEGRGFGGDFLLKRGYSVVAFKSSRDDWWQSLSLEDAAAISDQVGPVQATYGSSAGGYAALQFASVLRAERAIAISPQFDIRQPWEHRWAGFASAVDWKHRAEGTGPRAGFVFFDPYDLDRRHVEQFRQTHAMTDWHLYALPFSGHPAGHAMQAAGYLPQVIVHALHGRHEAIPSLLMRTPLRARRRQSAALLHALGMAAFHRKHFRAALSILDMAIGVSAEYADIVKHRAHIAGLLHAHTVGDKPDQTARHEPVEFTKTRQPVPSPAPSPELRQSVAK